MQFSVALATFQVRSTKCGWQFPYWPEQTWSFAVMAEGYTGLLCAFWSPAYGCPFSLCSQYSCLLQQLSSAGTRDSSRTASHCDMSGPSLQSLQHEQGKGYFEESPLRSSLWYHDVFWVHSVFLCSKDVASPDQSIPEVGELCDPRKQCFQSGSKELVATLWWYSPLEVSLVFAWGLWVAKILVIRTTVLIWV